MTAGGSHGVKLGAKFTHLLLNLVPNLLRLFPIEAHSASLILHRKRLKHGRRRIGDAGEHPLVAAFFLGFDGLPILGHLFRGQALAFGRTAIRSKDVRMAEDHLLAQFLCHVGNVVLTLLLCDFGIKDDVQKDVAQLFFQLFVVVGHNGIGQFINLLYRHRTQCINCLRLVPGTVLPKAVHNIQKASEGRQFFFSTVHKL